MTLSTNQDKDDESECLAVYCMILNELIRLTRDKTFVNGAQIYVVRVDATHST